MYPQLVLIMQRLQNIREVSKIELKHRVNVYITLPQGTFLVRPWGENSVQVERVEGNCLVSDKLAKDIQNQLNGSKVVEVYRPTKEETDFLMSVAGSYEGAERHRLRALIIAQKIWRTVRGQAIPVEAIKRIGADEYNQDLLREVLKRLGG